MTELCDIAYKYGTDKCPQLKHHFTEWYYSEFNDRREQVRKVLEIGIGCLPPKNVPGASLLMWHEWFPNAWIYGADIDMGLVLAAKDRQNHIETFYCDQRNAEDLRMTVQRAMLPNSDPIDLVVDDGTHKSKHQIFTCINMMPLLPKSVTYVIEDAGYVQPEHLPDYAVEVWKPRRRKYRDDRLIIVRHKDG